MENIKLIIAGSRNIDNYTFINLAIDYFKIDLNYVKEIISGGAKGIDSLAKIFAQKNNIKFIEFNADWNKYGKKAGSIRNKQMAMYADQLLVIHNNTPGSLNMILNMKSLNKQIFDYNMPKILDGILLF